MHNICQVESITTTSFIVKLTWTELHPIFGAQPCQVQDELTENSFAAPAFIVGFLYISDTYLVVVQQIWNRANKKIDISHLLVIVIYIKNAYSTQCYSSILAGAFLNILLLCCARV